jgi:hypothetical protein
MRASESGARDTAALVAMVVVVLAVADAIGGSVATRLAVTVGLAAVGGAALGVGPVVVRRWRRPERGPRAESGRDPEVRVGA